MTRAGVLAIAALLTAAIPARAWAQAHGLVNNDWPKVAADCGAVFSPSPPPPPSDPAWKRLVTCATGLFTARPIHPTIKSVVPLGSFGLAPTLVIQPNSGKWQNTIQADGTRTFTGFWYGRGLFRATHDALGRNTTARDRLVIEVYGQARGLPQLPFYGLGPDSSLDQRRDFRQMDDVFGAHLFNPFSARFAAGLRVERMGTTVGDVRSASVLPLSGAFDESSAPGIGASVSLLRLQVYARPRPARHVERADYTVEYNWFHDLGSTEASFQRFEVNGSHAVTVPVWGPSVFTVTDRLSLSRVASGGAIPYFLQPTLGGTDINGVPSLRGFADYRFRAPDLAAVEASYDQHLFWFFGAVAFVDFGEVAARWSAFNAANIRHSYGTGLTVWAGGRVWFRASVGFGSGEGRHWYVGIPVF